MMILKTVTQETEGKEITYTDLSIFSRQAHPELLDTAKSTEKCGHVLDLIGLLVLLLGHLFKIIHLLDLKEQVVFVAVLSVVEAPRSIPQARRSRGMGGTTHSCAGRLGACMMTFWALWTS